MQTQSTMDGRKLITTVESDSGHDYGHSIERGICGKFENRKSDRKCGFSSISSSDDMVKTTNLRRVQIVCARLSEQKA